MVADSRAPRDGAFISIIGHYNPLTDPETVVIDKEQALRWLGQGAQPTVTAARLLSKAGIIEAKVSIIEPKAGIIESKVGTVESKADTVEKSKPIEEKT